jgi:hypothetical protein
MANVHRPTSTVPTAAGGAALVGVLALACVALASWAMWTMLGAAFASDWLQVALTLMLWTAAVGAARVSWYSATGSPSARSSRSTSRAKEQRGTDHEHWSVTAASGRSFGH